MDKILTIDGKEVGFRATALTPRLYRHKIGRDIIRDLNRLRKAYVRVMQVQQDAPSEDATPEELSAYTEALQDAQLDVLDLEIFEDAAYIMAKQYDASIPGSPEEWLEEFSTFSVYKILPELLELWTMNQLTTSTSKKK